MANSVRSALTLLTAVLLGTFASVSHAQADHSAERHAAGSDEKSAGLAEVVVTAEKRSESIQSLPIAISAYSGEALAAQGVDSIRSLEQISPSVRVPMNDNNDVNVVIRGIGSFGGFEPAVALVMDGVAYSSIRGGTFNLFDVDRVEVLRGPQGTIGGRNATAGGIYVTSKRPTDEVEGYLKSTLGERHRVGLEGAVGGPIIPDKLLARLAVFVDEENGWVTNTLNHQDIENVDTREARLSIEGRVTQDFRALLTLQAVLNRARNDSYVVGKARPDLPGPTPPYDQPSFQFDFAHDSFQADGVTDRNDKIYQGALRLEWDLSANNHLTAITGYYATDNNSESDSTPIADIFLWPFPRLQTLSQPSQELILTGQLNERFDYIVGALYQHNDLLTREAVVSLPNITYANPYLLDGDRQKLSSWSGYGQVRYRLTDRIRLTAGTRYTADRKSVHSRLGFTNTCCAEASGYLSSSGVTPRFSIDWQATDNLMMYFTAARGFKSGGFDEWAIPSHSYNPEFVWNYEVGLKLRGWDDRLQTNATVFTMDYTNLQNRLVHWDPNQGGIQINTVNAATAKIKGVEWEVKARPATGLELSAAATYLHTRYGSLHAADPLYPELGELAPDGVTRIRDASGNQLLGAPPWQYNAVAMYTAPLSSRLEGALRVAYSWNGRAYADIFNNPNMTVDSHGLWDASLSVQTPDGKWKLSAFGENLTDKRYGLWSFAQEQYNAKSTYFGAPRRVGVSLEYHF